MSVGALIRISHCRRPFVVLRAEDFLKFCHPHPLLKSFEIVFRDCLGLEMGREVRFQLDRFTVVDRCRDMSLFLPGQPVIPSAGLNLTVGAQQVYFLAFSSS